MDRRHFLRTSLAGVLAATRAAGAQPASGTPRIGYMAINLTARDNRPYHAFIQGLRDLGYVEGKNLVIEYRDAEGNPDRFPGLAAELAARKVSVILAGGGTLGTMAAKQATSTIPIVFGAVGDPVTEGLVTSFARPGGNLTGLAINSPELASKSLELLKQAMPGLTRVALLLKPDAAPPAVTQERIKSWDATAQGLGMQLQIVEARDPAEFERAFSDMARARTGAVTVPSTPVFDAALRRLIELAAKYRLPTVYTFKHYVDAGGLMSYGPDIADLFRRAATYVDKILKGARPGDLPVEQPTKFELVINRKTAKALGLTIPPHLLARADQVIE